MIKNNLLRKQLLPVQTSYQYTPCGELIDAGINTDRNTYRYDNIGNRQTALEILPQASNTLYTTNPLNQYTRLQTENSGTILPQYDLDGNQTFLKTTTGEWNVEYDYNNRPVKFTRGDTIIESLYDYMGRRTEKKITQNGVITQHLLYAYRDQDYLQIAAFDIRSNQQLQYTLLWDPLYEQATRPLFLKQNGNYYSYGFDLNKNVTELFNEQGEIICQYDYAPYGEILEQTETISNPLKWSSEVDDPETGLTYYNYRHYNPTDGRWINGDLIEENGGNNLYSFVDNEPIMSVDILGAWRWSGSGSGLNPYDKDVDRNRNKPSEKEPKIGEERIRVNWTPITSETHNCNPHDNASMTLSVGISIAGLASVETSQTDQVPPCKAGWYEGRVREVYEFHEGFFWDSNRWTTYPDIRTQFKDADCN